ncbi:variable surface lipoprotein [Mycoplasma sp. Ms02]|uniref:variable surface lipoprotein n=1 Tax=Mycoplasma sp. Ms02 TaxID=353851 RepID=UPI001C8A357B|nr:variable surface lipoprotein [Mycoplasma sp. Ms02]QZE12069.1 hypothetical protein K4L35_01775 [Mycoplasma sp. Ms02]
MKSKKFLLKLGVFSTLTVAPLVTAACGSAAETQSSPAENQSNTVEKQQNNNGSKLTEIDNQIVDLYKKYVESSAWVLEKMEEGTIKDYLKLAVETSKRFIKNPEKYLSDQTEEEKKLSLSLLQRQYEELEKQMAILSELENDTNPTTPSEESDQIQNNSDNNDENDQQNIESDTTTQNEESSENENQTSETQNENQNISSSEVSDSQQNSEPETTETNSNNQSENMNQSTPSVEEEFVLTSKNLRKGELNWSAVDASHEHNKQRSYKTRLYLSNDGEGVGWGLNKFITFADNIDKKLIGFLTRTDTGAKYLEFENENYESQGQITLHITYKGKEYDFVYSKQLEETKVADDNTSTIVDPQNEPVQDQTENDSQNEPVQDQTENDSQNEHAQDQTENDSQNKNEDSSLKEIQNPVNENPEQNTKDSEINTNDKKSSQDSLHSETENEEEKQSETQDRDLANPETEKESTSRTSEQTSQETANETVVTTPEQERPEAQKQTISDESEQNVFASEKHDEVDNETSEENQGEIKEKQDETTDIEDSNEEVQDLTLEEKSLKLNELLQQEKVFNPFTNENISTISNLFDQYKDTSKNRMNIVYNTLEGKWYAHKEGSFTTKTELEFFGFSDESLKYIVNLNVKKAYKDKEDVLIIVNGSAKGPWNSDPKFWILKDEDGFYISAKVMGKDGSTNKNIEALTGEKRIYRLISKESISDESEGALS